MCHRLTKATISVKPAKSKPLQNQTKEKQFQLFSQTIKNIWTTVSSELLYLNFNHDVLNLLQMSGYCGVNQTNGAESDLGQSMTNPEIFSSNIQATTTEQRSTAGWTATTVLLQLLQRPLKRSMWRRWWETARNQLVFPPTRPTA